MINKYEYKRPEGKLYKISVSYWNKYFGNRGRFQVVECYVTENKMTFHFLPTLYGKICVAILSPILLLFYGIANWKESYGEIIRIIHPKKYGSFGSDDLFNSKRSEKSWNKAKKMLKID